jgi:hypothetical protein
MRVAAVDHYTEWLALTDRDLLTRVLRHTGWNQVQAAKTLALTDAPFGQDHLAGNRGRGMVREIAEWGAELSALGPRLPSMPVADYSPALVAGYPPIDRIATTPLPQARPHHPRRGLCGGTYSVSLRRRNWRQVRTMHHGAVFTDPRIRGFRHIRCITCPPWTDSGCPAAKADRPSEP